jgi:hypothetical protein
MFWKELEGRELEKGIMAVYLSDIASRITHILLFEDGSAQQSLKDETIGPTSSGRP